MAQRLIGIDLGGTNIKIGCFDDSLTCLAKTSVQTGADLGPEAVVERMADAVERLLSDQGESLTGVAAAGLGTPGPADYRAGVILQSANMPTFRNTPLRDLLAQRLGCPVAFENDANTACFGEFTVGAGRDIDDMVFFTLGTGIGCGIVCDGRLVRGATGNAAEVGHMIVFPGGEPCNCGQRGCVEAYASASHTARRAAEAVAAGEPSSLSRLQTITCKDVFEHRAQGDALATRITDQTAEALALVCVNMLHVTDPARVVFAGGMIGAGEPLLQAIRHHFHRHLWTLKQETVEIVFASLGQDAGIIGAAALARQQVQSH